MTRTAIAFLAVATLLSLAACGGDRGGATGGVLTLQGSGASFPAPLYARWFQEFNRADPGIRVNYQATGSGAGKKAIIEGTVDFAGSDAAMEDDEIPQVKNGVVLLPVTAGAIVLAYNLPGIENLRLSRDAYTGIFLGEIRKWNDPRITGCNPGVTMPDKDVTVVRRSDGSGTTYVFTMHLSAVSPKWRDGPGKGTSVDWPIGLGGKKNDGVAALLKQTDGSIGYVEYGFAVSGGLGMAVLENKAGKYVAATAEASAAALANVELPADLRAWASDPAGDASYPIVTYTWILAYRKYDKPATANALKKVLRWCLTEGQKLSAELHYVPLPQNVAQRVLAALDTIQ